MRILNVAMDLDIPYENAMIRIVPAKPNRFEIQAEIISKAGYVILGVYTSMANARFVMGEIWEAYYNGKAVYGVARNSDIEKARRNGEI